MPVLLKTLEVAFPVFAIIAIGYVFARLRKIDLRAVIDLLLYITIPALVISSLSRKPLETELVVTVAVSACAVVAATGVVAFLYLRLTGRAGLRGFYLPTMFMNTGNMGLPLALLAFGQEGLTVAVLYYVTMSIVVYTAGIYIASGRGGFREVLSLPLIYAAVLALGLNEASVAIPGPLLTTIDMLGAATIPLMQLSLGYRLYSTRITSPGATLASSVIRIGGGFAAALLITQAFNIGGVTAKVIILASSMPSAVINFIISHRYNLDADFVSSSVALSTLLSVITVPLILLWLI
jgi:hypothetical protein